MDTVFIKELKLASRGFYFYVELFMAIILLVVLLFVIPENFVSKSTEYLYFDLPKAVVSEYKKDMLKDDLDGQVEKVEIKSKKDLIPAEL